MIIRDYDRRLVLAVSVPLMHVSAPLAEMIGAWTAVKFAIFRLGGTKIWVMH